MNSNSKAIKELLIFSSIFVCLLSGCGKESDSDRADVVPAAVITQTISHQVIARPVQAQGEVQPLRQENLLFRSRGLLLRIKKKEGARVSKGDTLASLDAAGLVAAWEEAGLKFMEARDRLKEMQNQHKEGRINKRRLDDEERSTELLRQMYLSAKSAKLNARLIAPFKGRILRWFSAEGDSVTVGQPAALLADVDPFALARVDLSEDDVHRVAKGDSAVVNASGKTDFPLQGVVRSTSLSSRLSALPYCAMIRFENPGYVLTIGSRVDVTVFSKKKEKVVLIPQVALLERQGSSAVVYLTDVEGKFAVRRYLELGPDVGEKVIVDKGLQDGDRLIVYGQDRLKVGSKILVMKKRPKGNP